MADIYIDFEKFRPGLYVLDDTTKAPAGSARVMNNMQVTDRGGIAPRQGTQSLGTYVAAPTAGVGGAFNFKKSFAQNEIIMRGNGTKLQIYSKNHTAADWFTLKDGFTDSQEFGFATSLVNTDDQDYVVFSNRYEPYMRWNGAIALITSALLGGETTITVDSTLTEEIYQSKIATSSSATTLTVTGVAWVANQWINLFVYIPGTGKVSKITGNTTDTLTFATLGSDPGAVAFQIRKLVFADVSGTIIYNGTEMAYTAIPTSTTITVGSAVAAPINTGLAESPTSYSDAPRGNRLTNYLARIVVGNVRSAVARDSGGALQGYASGGSAFVSKQDNPVDFGYSASRVAGEGDIISMPYGGGEITDVVAQESSFYVFKKDYIESIQYSQDTSDLAERTPLKSGIGSVGKTIRGVDDIYFITKDNKFVSLGRVKLVDQLPQTINLGFQIKRLLDTYDSTDICGIEHKDKIYFSLKSTSTLAANDITLVYNRQFNSFDGVWNIGANAFFEYGDDSNLYFAESNTGNIYQVLTGTADIAGSSRYEIGSQYLSNYLNLAPRIRGRSKAIQTASSNAINALYFEGYILDGTTINFKMFSDFKSDPSLSFSFSPEANASTLDNTLSSAAMGLEPMGLSPMGTISDPDEDGRRHFSFRVYFPYVYGQYFSIGFDSLGTDLDYEIIRYGLVVLNDVSWNPGKVVEI